MLSKINYLIFLFTLLLIGGCTQNKSDTKNSSIDESGTEVISNPEYGALQENENPVQFELVSEFTFKETDDLLVGSIGDLNTDSDGNIYFYDFRFSRIVSLDENGDVRWVTGQEGKGPGDFMRVRGMVLHNDLLYISNQSGSRLDRFNLNGEYLGSSDYPLEIDGSSILGFSDDGKLILSQSAVGIVGTKIHVVEFDGSSFTPTNSFDVDQSGGKEIPKNVGMSVGIEYQDGQIISGSAGKDYELDFYNLDGKIAKTINRDFDKLSGIGSANGMTLSYSSIQYEFELKSGHFFVFARWAAGVTDADQEVKKRANENYVYPTNKNTLDLFTQDGKLLYSIEGDGSSFKLGYPVHTDQNGLVYFMTTSPTLSLKKYRVTIKER
ncbi:MAG: hypothetical protein CL670_05660 [Balneola sp.]|jgi:hypothetical protein|nr:hypothetical protein [Balneola sp.]MBE78621.1 hypothetical protein [Balneola sp.]|tara:strand:- start:520 stop:1662 length:1143 start_codon:yes stop_codon:yes gene_type:complete